MQVACGALLLLLLADLLLIILESALHFATLIKYN